MLEQLCTIRMAFPLIPDDILPGMLPDLPSHAPIGELAQSRDALATFDFIAEWMLRKPGLCIGASLPGLWLNRDASIQGDDIPGRVLAAFSRLRITVWGEIIELTPSLLIDIQGFGEGSLQPFLAVAARVSAEACCRKSPPSRCPVINIFEARPFSPRSSIKNSEFRRLVEWAISETQAVSVADFVAACTRLNLPEDIRSIRDSFQSARLADLFPSGKLEAMEQLLVDLAGVLDNRTQPIFFSRISLNNQRTLEDLATDIGVTKERVRQLWVRGEERVREALTSPRFAPIIWRAHTLGTLLGTAIPPEKVDDALAKISGDVSESKREQFTDLLLWLCGPYSWDSSTNWLRSADMPTLSVVNSFMNECGRVDIERLRQYLASSGLHQNFHSIWMERIGKVKNVEGNWLLWNGSVPDKAALLLEIWGEPATAEAIATAIGEGHEVRSTRTRLFEDERFMRVDLNRVGLRSWGMEEYSTIAEGIEQELERRGGSSDVGQLISTLTERFNMKESSVKFYVTAPRFVLDGGILRLRTSADPRPPVRPITESPACYLLGPDTLSWRMDVTADTLRGSGRPLPAAIAGWLGVVPGGKCVLKAAGGTVRISWLETSTAGPALGSVRFLAETIAAKVGDQVLLYFRRDESTLSMIRVDYRAVDAASGFDRIALLTGIPNNDGEGSFLHALGQAIGCRGTRAAIGAELRKRGESELAALVPAEAVSPDLDAAIDAMKDLF